MYKLSNKLTKIVTYFIIFLYWLKIKYYPGYSFLYTLSGFAAADGSRTMSREFSKDKVKEAKKANGKRKLSVFKNEAVIIASIYWVFGALWIILSDRILELVIPNMETYKHLQTYKGWFYILVTTLMLFFLIRDRIILLRDENKKTQGAYNKLSIAHGELTTAKAELVFQKELTESIINDAPVFIFTHNEESMISLNPFAQKMCGYGIEDLHEKNWIEILVPVEYRDQVRKVFKGIRERKQLQDYEVPLITKDGFLINVLWNSTMMSSREDEEGHYFVSIGVDINERKHYEDQIEHLAYYDRLTGLPNRAKFESEINEQINRNIQGNYFMIAYIDIDNFKNINDSMGHQVGDLFLNYLGERLRDEISEPNSVARLGGDEFAILFVRMLKDEVLLKLEALIQRISRTWTIENRQFYISMSVGVVSYPFDGTDSTTLLKNADIAMYTAKREGKNRVLFYQKEIYDNNARQIKMINNLQYGIENEHFVLYYQPQFCLKTGRVLGVEALVRWIHPEEGFIPPSEFIPLAEESGQIYKLERWIVRQALRQKKQWELEGYGELEISINLSGKTLTSTINFREIEQILQEAPVNYEGVVIEITETANISDVDIVIEHLQRLRNMGIRIALDDFGTGYSSLNYLKMFPINIIKLDQSFIRAINENSVDMLLIKNILRLAHDLEFYVVAEGIETQEQLEFLRNGSCNSGQGYLLSKPVPVEMLNPLLMKDFYAVNYKE